VPPRVGVDRGRVVAELAAADLSVENLLAANARSILSDKAIIAPIVAGRNIADDGRPYRPHHRLRIVMCISWRSACRPNQRSAGDDDQNATGQRTPNLTCRLIARICHMTMPKPMVRSIRPAIIGNVAASDNSAMIALSLRIERAFAQEDFRPTGRRREIQLQRGRGRTPTRGGTPWRPPRNQSTRPR